MFIKVCDDFIQMMRELVKRDIEFRKRKLKSSLSRKELMHCM